MKKRGLKKFQELYDELCGQGGTALDLAQNLRWKFEMMEPAERVTEEDVQLAYEICNMRSMDLVHDLAKALGFTREDYIENAHKRRKEGNVSIHVLGQKSVNMDFKDLIPS